MLHIPFGNQLYNDIKAAMSDPNTASVDKYFTQLVNTINSYFPSRILVSGTFAGFSPTGVPIGFPVIFKTMPFTCQAAPIQNSIAKADYKTPDANRMKFANAVAAQLRAQQLKMTDEVKLVNLNGPVLFTGLLPLVFDLASITDPLDANMKIAEGIFNALLNMPMMPLTAPAISVAAPTGGVTFNPLQIMP